MRRFRAIVVEWASEKAFGREGACLAVMSSRWKEPGSTVRVRRGNLEQGRKKFASSSKKDKDEA